MTAPALDLALAGTGLILLSALAGITRRAGPVAHVALMSVGSAVGLAGALRGLLGGVPVTRDLWTMAPVGTFSLGMDGLTAFFLVPVFTLPALCAVYGIHHWPDDTPASPARRARFFFALLTAGLALLVLARDAVSFLCGWEVMALAGFFLVTAEDERAEVREAGWLYLVATHMATLVLLAVFGLLRAATGDSAMQPIPAAGPVLLWSVFLLGTVGFGLKAGVMPLHVWLPPAHAAAPSHVSAVMSGLLIKAGIYGLVRLLSLLPPLPLGAGTLLLILGSVSGLLGVAFALGQHDLKRLLAYHSIENIGIIVIGIGLATVGRTLGQPAWIALGLGGALLHVWNHGLFKALLFLSAGSAVHATGTREVDKLGGLARRMPWTAGLFLLGSVAICGLPPLNGFVSELLIYLGLFHTAGVGGGVSWPAAALAAPILAMTGALAVACFVKVFGIAFLGEPRSAHAAGAHEAPRVRLVPMAALALACAVIGLAPPLVAPVLTGAMAGWAPEINLAGSPLTALAPLWPLATVSLLCWSAGALGIAWLFGHLRRGRHREVGTWDCGYVAPAPRMQYTASSFAQILVDQFAWALRPHRRRRVPAAPFPENAQFESHVPDPVLEEAVLPAAGAAERLLLKARAIQQGRVQSYILYVLAAVVALFVWLFPLRDLLERLAK